MLKMIIVDIIVIALLIWAVVKFLQHDERKHKRENRNGGTVLL